MNLTKLSGVSRNDLQVFEYKTSVNVKGSLEGTYNDGKIVGDAEVVLPSGRILAGKINRVIHLGPEDNSIDGSWEVMEYASKGAQPRKLALKLAGKNIKLVKLQFDGQADLTYVSPNNEDVTLHLAGKKVPQGDKWTVSGQVRILFYILHLKVLKLAIAVDCWKGLSD